MALEQILAALEADLDARIVEIETQAAAEVQALKAEAERDAHAVESRHLEAIQSHIRAATSRCINAARLEAQRMRLEARESLVEAVFAATQDQLSQVRRHGDYSDVLAGLVCEILDALGTPLRLAVDPQDAGRIRELLRDATPDVTVEQTLQTWGGAIGRTPDGRIVVDNTLETRFAQVQELCRGQVADLLTQKRCEDNAR